MIDPYLNHFEELCERINYNSVVFVLETGKTLAIKDLRSPKRTMPLTCSLNINYDLIPTEHSKTFYGQNLTLGNQMIICSGSVNVIDIGTEHLVIVFYEPRITNFRDNQLPRILWKDLNSRYLGHSEYVPADNSVSHTFVGYTDADLYEKTTVYSYKKTDDAIFSNGVCFWDVMGEININGFTTLVKLEKIPYYSSENEILGALIVYQPINQVPYNFSGTLKKSLSFDQSLINKILAQANIFIAIQNLEGEKRIESYSDNLVKLGYDLDLFISGKLSIRDIIYPGDYDRFLKEVTEKLYEKKEPVWLTVRILSAKLEIIPAKIFLTPVLDEKQKISKIAMLMDCYDVTEGVSMNFDKLSVAINRTPTVFTVRKLKDLSSYEIITENFNQFGYNAIDLSSGKLRFRDLIMKEDLPIYDNAVKLIVDRKVQSTVCEYRLISRKKQTYWIRETMFLAVVRGVEYLESAMVDFTQTKTAFEILKIKSVESQSIHSFLHDPSSVNLSSALKYADVNTIFKKYSLLAGSDIALFNNFGLLMGESTGKPGAIETLMKQLVDFKSMAGEEPLVCLYDNLFLLDFPVLNSGHRFGTLVFFGIVSDFPTSQGSRFFTDSNRLFQSIKKEGLQEIRRIGEILAETIGTMITSSTVALMQIQSSSNFAGDLTKQRISHKIILELLNIASTSDDIESCFNRMIPVIGKATQLTRCSLFTHSEADDDYSLTYEWFVDQELSRKNFFQHMKKDFTFFQNWDIANQVSLVLNTEDTTTDPKHLREIVRAIVAVRLSNKDKVYGFLNFVDNFSARKWTSDEIIFFEDIGYIFSSVVERLANKNALSHNLQEYIRSMESMPAAIAILEKETKICQVANQNFWDLVSGTSGNQPGNYSDLGMVIKRILAVLDSHVLEKEIHFSDSDKWFLISKSDINFDSGGDSELLILTDITQNKKTQETISSLAFSDVLTGLPNRLKFEMDLKSVFEGSPQDYAHDFICLLNIDNFKMINNTFSYSVGDELLKNITKQLKTLPEVLNHLYRFGGDEFGIYIPQQSKVQVYDIAVQIMNVFEKPFYIDGYETNCSVSMGIVFLQDAEGNVNRLIRKANVSLKDAKVSGKNRYVLFDASLKKYEEDTDSLERAMKKAIDEGCEEFEVYFQPIVSAKTGKIISAEALVRWFSKEFGLVSPVKFIPLAESTGLIVPLGKFILNAACKEAKKWLDYGYNIKISVNFSVIQTLQSDLVPIILKALNTYRIPASKLIFEVTESLAINDIDKVVDILTAVRETGVYIAMDDFGTGYSSLNHLRKLPLDIVKIDRSFIFNIEYDPYTLSFVDTITKFCHMKNSMVCCEGVENETQRAMLSAVDVDSLQGYLFGKPCTADDFWKLLITNQK